MNVWKHSLRLLCATVCLATASASNLADPPQTMPQSAATVQDKALPDAAAKGIQLPAISNLADSANIQAVLIPPKEARHIFGKEISDHYAVVEVIVSNLDPKEAMVVHTLFMDDSNWLLRGGQAACAPQLEPAGPASNQKATQPCQVASLESRLVRGEALDAQQWTFRNVAIRALAAAGTVGAGFEFPFSPDVIKGISAWNGILVPAASTLFPDSTINQINRISDSGFQTNRIIGKASADIMVAFFPIDRFLTATFRGLFQRDPSTLFVPSEMLADPKHSRLLLAALKPLTDVLLPGSKEVAGDLLRSNLVDCTGDASSPTNKNLLKTDDDLVKMCRAQKLLAGLSLNNIRVVVGGVMTVDIAAVPATIYSVTFDKDDDKLWGKAADHTGTITGLYLTGSLASIVDATGKAIEGAQITLQPDGASDEQLNFKLSVKTAVCAPTQAFLVLTKTTDATSNDFAAAAAKAKKTTKAVTSTPFELSPQPGTCPANSGAASPAATPDSPQHPAATLTNPSPTTPKPREKTKHK